MIIKDTSGGKLRLTNRRLTEISHVFNGISYANNPAYFVFLKGLKNGGKASLHSENDICLNHKHEKDYTELISVSAKPRTPVIGCRTFDKETYAKILKAIKKAE